MIWWNFYDKGVGHAELAKHLAIRHAELAKHLAIRHTELAKHLTIRHAELAKHLTIRHAELAKHLAIIERSFTSFRMTDYTRDEYDGHAEPAKLWSRDIIAKYDIRTINLGKTNLRGEGHICSKCFIFSRNNKYHWEHTYNSDGRYYM